MATEATATKAKPTVSMGWRRWLLGRLWFVHLPVVLMIRGTPAVCLQLLLDACRPNSARLHQRNLFAGGRRYELMPTSGGFRLVTTSKAYRRRTRTTAVMRGAVVEMGDAVIQIQLETHVNLFRLAEYLFVPTFMTSIVWFVPWRPIVIMGIVTVLYGLSWLAYRYTAALEANEMVFFVQKALEELELVETLTLGAEIPGVMYGHAEFMSEWDKFYRRHQSDDTVAE